MQAVGEVRGVYVNAVTQRETDVFLQKNLILNEGADIMAGLLAGGPGFAISHMYLLFENTNGAVSDVPTLARADGHSWFESIDGVTPLHDWLRVPIITTPRISAVQPVGESGVFFGNTVTFMATTAASASQAGESPAKNYFAPSGDNGPSKTFSVALVAATNPNSRSGDRVFSRLNLETPMTAIAGHFQAFYWSIRFN